MKLALKVLAVIFCAQPTFAQHATLVLPETGKSISLSFELMPGKQGNFRSIRVASGGDNFHFALKTPITRIPANAAEQLHSGVWNKVPGLQLDGSRYFFRGEYSADSKPHTLLFFVGEPGASNPGRLFVLGFTGDGTPYKVLERNNLDILSFQSSEDSNAFIVGKATMSQVMAGDGGNGSKTPYATTYDPFSVFVVHGPSQAKYSLRESRKYNEAHYVWAGPHSREDYAVLYNLPGHKKLVGAPASRIEAILGGKRIPQAQ